MLKQKYNKKEAEDLILKRIISDKKFLYNVNLWSNEFDDALKSLLKNGLIDYSKESNYEFVEAKT